MIGRGLEGEIIGPNEEDQILARKPSDELPQEVANWWKALDLKLRRMIISDQELLQKTSEELLEIAIFANPDFQTLVQRSGIGEQGELSIDRIYDADPALRAKDITPKHNQNELEFQRKLIKPE